MKEEINLSYESVKAKVGPSEGISKEHYIAMEKAKIDRTESCFGGKGILTNEQYQKGMRLVREMKKKKAW